MVVVVVVRGVAAPVRVDALLPVSTCKLKQVRAKAKGSCRSRQNSMEEMLQGRGSRALREGMAAKNNQ